MQSVTDQLANCSDREVMKSLRPRQILQAVKAICAFLGNIETLEIQEICDQLVKQCLGFDKAKGNEEPSGRVRPEIVEEVGERYATVVLTSMSTATKDHTVMIKATIEKIKETVQKMIETYAKTFRVNFSLDSRDDKKSGRAARE